MKLSWKTQRSKPECKLGLGLARWLRQKDPFPPHWNLCVTGFQWHSCLSDTLPLWKLLAQNGWPYSHKIPREGGQLFGCFNLFCPCYTKEWYPMLINSRRLCKNHFKRITFYFKVSLSMKEYFITCVFHRLQNNHWKLELASALSRLRLRL